MGAPAPLQEGAAAVVAELDEAFYANLSLEYQRRRDFLLPLLEQAGFSPYRPRGAYYAMAEYPQGGFSDDVEFTRYLIEHVGVAVVPASSFYRKGQPAGRGMVRFCFPKRDETLLEAGRRLSKLESAR